MGLKDLLDYRDPAILWIDGLAIGFVLCTFLIVKAWIVDARIKRAKRNYTRFFSEGEW